MTDTPKKPARGFASLSAARRIEIASMGGKTAQQAGRAHKWSSEEAKEAGRKGAAARKLKKIGRPVVQG
jgi:general stress protein YciG